MRCPEEKHLLEMKSSAEDRKQHPELEKTPEPEFVVGDGRGMDVDFSGYTPED